MDTDEGPLINENSNGLSHLLTDGEFNSVDAAVVDESSTSNQAFLNAVELSTGSVGDYLDNNTGGFNTDSFDVGDNAVNFPSDSLNNVLSDGDSRLSDAFKTTPNDIDLTENQKTVSQLELDMELTQDTSNETRSNQDFNMSSFNERNDTLPSDQDNTNDTLVEQSVKKSRKKRRSSKDEDDNKKNQNSNDRNRLSERKQDSVHREYEVRTVESNVMII